GTAGGDIAKQMRDHALRQIIGLDFVRNRHALQFRRKAPMTADHPLDETRMGEMVEASILAVALAGSIDQCEVLRLALCIRRFAFALEVKRFQRNRYFLGKADTDKAAGGH